MLLCKAADDANEPHAKDFYESFFSKSEDDLLFEYFDAASGGTVDVSGSRVYGWFDMLVDTAEIAPDVRNNAKPVTRTQTARDCRASALGALAGTGTRVDPATYSGVITVINVPVDSGAAGEKSVVVHSPENDVGFVVHEMLHVLGLRHSWRMSPDGSSDHVWGHGGDQEYGDCWDMMSYRTCVFTFQTARGPQGPELHGEYGRQLGWLPSDRIDSLDQRGFLGPRTVKLAPVSDPSRPGFLLARIEMPQGFYVVEYRERSRFDQGIPFNAVVIRELRSNGLTYLVQRQGGGTGWRKGETFTDTGNFLRISVDDIVPGEATVTIDPAYSPGGPAPEGALCGDKYRGQVIPCNPSCTCRSRRTGMLVSIDWFCLVP